MMDSTSRESEQVESDDLPNDRTPLLEQSKGSTNVSSYISPETSQSQSNVLNAIPPPQENEKKTSNVGTLLHIIKGNVGTGILAMPTAISNFGLLAGIVGIVLLGILCTYCMHLLVKCSKLLVQKIAEKHPEAAIPVVVQGAPPIEGSLDYASTVEVALKFGPTRLQRLAFAMRCLINGLLILTQFGFCSVYLLFVADSLHEVSRNMNVTILSSGDIMLLELIVIIPLNFIPTLEALTAISSFAVVLQTAGLAMMFAFFLRAPFSDSVIPYVAPVGRWPLFFGTAMFSFEGIGVVLPLENEMKHKKAFRGWLGMLNIGMTIVIHLYLAVGVAGYVKYGALVKPSITFNLPVGCFSEMIRIMFAVAILLSYPLQMYVAFTFILPFLREKCRINTFPPCAKYVMEGFFRTVMVLITFCVARSVPLLDLVISFIGSFASSGLAIILPPLTFIICIWESNNMKHKKLIITLNLLISVFGLFGLIVGAGTAVNEIIIASKNRTETTSFLKFL